MAGKRTEVPKEFFDAVDEFIDVANRLTDKFGSARVSSIIMYAAARYNAFRFVTSEPEPAKNKDAAIEYFQDQYALMLRENIDKLAKHPDYQMPNPSVEPTPGKRRGSR